MKEDTLGRLLVDAALPPKVPRPTTPLDKKTTAALFQHLATIEPGLYRQTAKKLTDLAAEAGTLSGGYSFGPEHLRPTPEVEAAKQRLAADVARILADSELSDKDRNAKLVHAGLAHAQPLTDAVAASTAGNPLALQVTSGAKGNMGNLKSMMAGDTLYTDSEYNPVPYPVTHSFYEGLRPHEFAAGTFGARTAIILTKLGTAVGGYFCLGKGTLVRMADGSTKPIENVVAGDLVLGSSTGGVLRPTRVTAVCATGVKPVNRYTFRYGRSRTQTFTLDATPEHRVLLRQKAYTSVQTGGASVQQKNTTVSVKPCDVLTTTRGHVNQALVASASFDDTGYPDFDRALLVGLLLGDGYIAGQGRVTLSSGDAQGMDDLAPYFNSVGLVARPRNAEHPHEYRLCYAEGCVSGTNWQWLEDLDLIGKKAPDKFIPDVVWRWSNRSVAALIAGLFATDGSFSISNQTGRPVVDFGMTARRVIDTLRTLLAVRFGIHASPVSTRTVEAINRTVDARPMSSKVKNKSPIRAKHDCHTLTISSRDDLRRFAELIKFVPTARVRAFVSAVDAMTDSVDDLTYGYAFVSCETLGAVPTYDIEVDHPDHLYLLASGAIVHNSKRLRSLSHRLVVSARDGPERPGDPVTGYHVDLADPDNEGATLSVPLGNFPRNTVLTRDVIADLRRSGHERAVVRSPMVGGPGDGGVYGLDVGARERGGIAPLGDQVGIAAADSLSEPATQSIIGCLAAGTMVRMADGTVRAIQDVGVGDAVLGSNENGVTAPTRVTHTFDSGVRECRRATFRVGARVLELRATGDHKVLVVPHRYAPGHPPPGAVQVPLRDLEPFSPRVADSSAYCFPVEIADAGPDQTYDIEVDHPDHLFVLANGLIVSNSKHSGGVAGATKSQQGFPALDRLMSIPGDYDGAVHATTDGVLSAVRAAPQGGQYVTVGGVEHYVPPDRQVTARHGDKIEAGDPLTDGLENPAQYTVHKGIGESRRRFVDTFMRAARDAGFQPLRRNLELIARGYIDHVEVQAEHGDHVPGDVVSYTALAHAYEPRPGHQRLAPDRALGMYLERPALHYTIGTQIKPSVVRALQGAGIGEVPVHPAPPPFTPVPVRSHDTISHDPDPLTRMLGSNLEKTLLRGVARGDSSDLKGTSFVPALAAGVDFNAPDSKTRAWDPKDVGR